MRPEKLRGATVTLLREGKRVSGVVTNVRALPAATLITLDAGQEYALDGPLMWEIITFNIAEMDITTLPGGVVIEARVKVGKDWIYPEPVRMMRVDWGPNEESQNQSPRKSWVTKDGVIVNDDRVMDPRVVLEEGK